MAEDASKKPGAEQQGPDPQQQAAHHRNEAIRLLELAAKHAKVGRRKQEVPRLYAQAAEEAVHASHVKDAIRYFQQAIEVAVTIGDLSSAKAMEERVAILKARIGFVG